jgi:DNA polymerase delta subunit 1
MLLCTLKRKSCQGLVRTCRYTGLKYEKDPSKPKGIDTKGLQLVRRDSVPLVREVSTAILDSILYNWDVMGARAQARKVIKDFLEGRIPIEKLTLTKALRTGYKNLDLPHLAVARKLEKRDPGSGPKPGDRVPYVLIDTGNSKDKQSEKAEDPAYAVKMGLPLDTEYYMVSRPNNHNLLHPIRLACLPSFLM